MLISPDENGITAASQAIRSGGLVAFPTDTFFALGADGLNASAVDRVFTTKGRNPGTPVPLLISDADMVNSLATEFPTPLKELAEEFWPGALTLVMPAASTVPPVVSARTDTVGLRVPDHQVARELIRKAGTPITGTSCNLTGRDPIKEAVTVEQVFGDQLDGCLNAECGDSTEPSTVISYEDGKITVLRLGAIGVESMRNVVGDIVGN